MRSTPQSFLAFFFLYMSANIAVTNVPNTKEIIYLNTNIFIAVTGKAYSPLSEIFYVTDFLAYPIYSHTLSMTRLTRDSLLSNRYFVTLQGQEKFHKTDVKCGGILPGFMV